MWQRGEILAAITLHISSVILSILEAVELKYFACKAFVLHFLDFKLYFSVVNAKQDL